MKKQELSCNENEAIVSFIKSVLLKYYPILENRVEEYFKTKGRFTITANFVKKNEKNFTQIIFTNNSDFLEK